MMPALEQKTRTGPKAGDGPLDQCADRLWAGHITRYGQSIDALRHLLGSGTVAIGHDDVGTLGGETLGQGPADAVSAACDDDALPFEVGH